MKQKLQNDKKNLQEIGSLVEPGEMSVCHSHIEVANALGVSSL